MKYLLLTLLLSSTVHADEADLVFYMQHAIDVAQTLQIARSDCHIEVGGAGMFIGENPSTDAVIAWGIATAIGYTMIKDKLPKWAKYINISFKTFTVNQNHRIGLGVGSHYCESVYEY